LAFLEELEGIQVIAPPRKIVSRKRKAASDGEVSKPLSTRNPPVGQEKRQKRAGKVSSTGRVTERQKSSTPITTGSESIEDYLAYIDSQTVVIK
jgi:hypothetical protein